MNEYLWMLAPVGFVAAWCLMSLLIAYVAGWQGMAKYFRATGRWEGTRFFLVSGLINSAQYKGSLTASVAPHGLYLGVLPLFAFGHPPLLIPWSAIGPVREIKQWLSTGCVFNVTVPEGNKVEITLFNREITQALRPYLPVTPLPANT